MYKSVQGIYRHGQVEFAENPRDIRDETPVIVTFLDSSQIDLSAHGITSTQAEELRGKLNVFAEEWDSPEMKAYDNYDTNKAAL